jgi:hypothetical protein
VTTVARVKAFLGLLTCLVLALGSTPVAPGAAAAAGSAAVPSGITVGQEGLAFRISWVYAAGEDSARVEVSTTSAFAEAPTGQPPTTCSDFALMRSTTLMRCPLAFTDNVWVRVTATTKSPVVVAVPASGFAFTPVPAGVQPVPFAVRNRQDVRCGTVAADWSSIDADTTFSGRVVSGSVERAGDDLPNPITGETPSSVTPTTIDYDVGPADVGQRLSCEVTATNGAWSATRVLAGVVGHAIVAEMDPRAMLLETSAPKHYVYFESPRRTKPTRKERRHGAVSKAHGLAEYGVSGDLDLWATVYGRTRQADRQVPKSFCPALRRSYRRASTPARPRAVLRCTSVRLPGARRAVSALAYSGGISDLGERIAVMQAIVVGSAGHTHFLVSSTWGGSFKARARSARKAAKAAGVAGPSLARSGATE